MLEILFAVFIALLFVTVIGHGIWVLLASIFRGSKPLPEHARRAPTHCPRCNAPLRGPTCSVCGWPVEHAKGRTIAAIDALEEQIELFAAAQALDPASRRELEATICRLRLELKSRVVAATDLYSQDVVEDVDVLDESAPATVVSTDDAGALGPQADAPAYELEDATRAPRTPEERARRFVQRQAGRLAELPGETEVPRETAFPPTAGPVRSPRARPERAWSDVLAAFMEEKNIRWGELVGGLLIVGCSIALVISFWAKIAERPFLKFFVFGGVTAALFGIGFYTERRWRLRTTSRGVLVIATLLVPLNFLAIAAFNQDASTHVLFLVGEAVSLALFAALVWAAGRILTPDGAVALAAGVMVPSVMQLLVRRLVMPGTGWPTLYGLCAAVIACHMGTNGWLLSRARKAEVLEEPRAHELLRLLGITTFAVGLALGLLLVKTGEWLAALHRLSPLVCALGLAPLAIGLFLSRTLAGREHIGLRVAGASIALAGAVLSLAAVVLAWPDPAVLLPAALAELLLFEVLAWGLAIPAAHAISIGSLALAYLLVVHWLRGDVTWWQEPTMNLGQTLLSGFSGTALAPLVIALGVVSAAALCFGRRADGLVTAGSTAVLAALSTLLVCWYGLGQAGDPLAARWVFGAYALGALVVCAVTGVQAAGWAAAALALAAVAQAVVFRWSIEFGWSAPWTLTLLVDASLCLVVALAARWRRGWMHLKVVESISISAAMLTSTAAVLLIGGRVYHAEFGPAAVHCFWLAALWLIAATLDRAALTWLCGQVALSIGVVLAVMSRLQNYAWFQQSAYPWLDPWTWEALGLALAAVYLCSIVWEVAAERLRPRLFGADAHERFGAAADRVFRQGLAALLVGGTFVLAYYAALPGIAQELAPRVPVDERVVPPATHFELLGVPHEHARGAAAWGLIAAVGLALAVGFARQPKQGDLIGGYLLAAACCALWSAGWESDVAVASALRWSSAVLLMVGSIPIWFRRRIGGLASRVGLNWSDIQPGAAAVSTTVVFLLALLPSVVMAVYVGTAAVFGAAQPPAISGLLPALAVLFVVAGLCAIGLRAAKQERSLVPEWSDQISALLLVLGTGPLLAAVLYVVGSALGQTPILGPDPDSWFVRIGSAASYAVPLLTTALVLVGYAVSERSERFAFAGGLMFNFAVSAGYLLLIARQGVMFDAAGWIRLAQLNAIVSSAYALSWLSALRQLPFLGTGRPKVLSGYLQTTIAIAAALLLIVAVPVWVGLLLGNSAAEAGSPAGWIAALMVVITLLVGSRGQSRHLSFIGVAAALQVLCVLIAGTGDRWGGHYVANHALLVAQTLSTWVLWVLACYRLQIESILGATGPVQQETAGAAGPAAVDEPAPAGPALDPSPALLGLSLPEVAGRLRGVLSDAMAGVIAFGVLALVVAARLLFDDSQPPWWAVGGLLSMAALSISIAYTNVERRWLFASLVLINVAASAWWIEHGAVWLGGLELRTLVYLLKINVIALALPAVGWVLLERRRFQPLGARQSLPAHRFAARTALVLLSLLVGLGLAAHLASQSAPTVRWVDWLALAATGVAVAACLWDQHAGDSVAGLYVLGLVAAGLVVDQTNMEPHWLAWTGTIVLAAYTVLTSYLWSLRQGLIRLARIWHIPVNPHEPMAGLAWLVPANLLLVTLVISLVFWIELTYAEFPLRLLAGQAAIAQAVSIGLLAKGARRSQLQYAALSLAVVAFVAFGWAWISPVEVNASPPNRLLERLVVIATALAVSVVLYGFGLARLLSPENEWRRAAHRLLPMLVLLTALAELVVIGDEGWLVFGQHTAVDLAWPGILITAVVLCALVAAALIAAVIPGRDPLSLGERGRAAYVYAAEAILATLFIHIRLTMPWLFQGFFARWWPMVVMGIAFLGVGLAEWFERRRVPVLAGPLGNTAVLLPLLPAIGFWVIPTGVDYSALLLVIGVLYAVLSGMRNSFGFGILAALSANGALWYFLHQHHGYRLFEHPQLWMIPPALCVMLAAYWHRAQLTSAQFATIRYACSIVIYVSSTADIFIVGVAQAPWLPLVLAGFSIAGILAGIWLRVRAFLFLGTAFLMLALLTIIWYAAVDLEQTWLWWAMGIVAGVLIIALFAVFEKKRDEVMALVEDVKQWTT